MHGGGIREEVFGFRKVDGEDDVANAREGIEPREAFIDAVRPVRIL